MPSRSLKLLKTLGILIWLWLVGSAPVLSQDGDIGLENAVIVTANRLSRAERSAVSMLAEEIEKRTLIRLVVKAEWPLENTPVIALGLAGSARPWAGAPVALTLTREDKRTAEGYAIRVIPGGQGKSTAVLVSGNDPRGVLFGTGRLLRELKMSRGRLRLSPGLDITSSPRFALRGHQLGYRPKTNSYDGWTEAMWRQYIRDLVVFGTNAVELIPPRSDDAADSPHFPLPQIEMMEKMSRILDDHDLDVWIWYPAMEADYSKPETIKAELKSWGEVFARLPRVDAVFVPGGDPGHSPPEHLMAFLERVTDELHVHHPRARMWMSPQGFNQEWMAEFLRLVKTRRPAWLSGVVYGPQTRVSLRELRAALPPQYPIRRYPDITHSLNCQYPVPGWDLAYALTEGREVINPRPVDEAAIFRAYKDLAIGFIAYSEGCNDDLNKILWSSLGWDPEADITEILRQYSRYFIGVEYQDRFAQGLFALERNWRGSLLDNTSIEAALGLFQAMEREAKPRDLLNWRFQQALYRAYYDAYTQRRLRYETGLEHRALDTMSRAASGGSLAMMERAEAVVQEVERPQTALDLRTRIYQLAEALFQSIRMQLSVPLYKAIDVGRGANLDTLDEPLNNRRWFRLEFDEIRKMTVEEERVGAILRIVHWEDPGPGGFYDDLGNGGAQPHLVPGAEYKDDPAFYQSPQTGIACSAGWRLSWCSHADALYDSPLRLRYTKLDAGSRYKVRIVYGGNLGNEVKLVANGEFEIHPMMNKPNPAHPVEFEIPSEATRQGELTLSWSSKPGRGGAGRGPQVAEVWLMRR